MRGKNNRIVGFEGVSEEKDEFPTSALEWRLVQSSASFLVFYLCIKKQQSHATVYTTLGGRSHYEAYGEEVGLWDRLHPEPG